MQFIVEMSGMIPTSATWGQYILTIYLSGWVGVAGGVGEGGGPARFKPAK